MLHKYIFQFYELYIKEPSKIPKRKIYMDNHSKFKTSVINHCKEIITDNHNLMFNMWLKMDADAEFGHGYQHLFADYFEGLADINLTNHLWFAGKNVIYAIIAFISMKNDKYELEELLQFVEKFVSAQLDELYNDYNFDDY